MVIPDALKTVLAATLYPVGSIRTILMGPARGLKYQIFPDLGLAPIRGGWEPEAQAFMVRYLRRGDTVYDIGANHGIHAILMARLVGSNGKVVAFEPVPAIYEKMVNNVGLNGFENVMCLKAAVSDRSGICDFSTEGHLGAGKLLSRDESSNQSMQVSTTSLDEFVETKGLPPDFIKIDVEGAESRVLHGGLRTISRHAPILLIDLHAPDEDKAVGRIFQRFGYRVFRTESGEPIQRLDKAWPEPNGIWGQVIGIPKSRSLA